MYYTVTTADPTGFETKHDKINHTTAILTINTLLEAYGFSRPISKNTFNSILCRPDRLPDRLKWLLNNNKLSIGRHGPTSDNKVDIIEYLCSLPEIDTKKEAMNKQAYGIAKAMYG